ncbi:hypothetical protein GW915_04760 [bacterium]|nr:hypothetical protein [bacterium]
MNKFVFPLLLALLFGCGYRVAQDEVKIDIGDGQFLKNPRIFIPIFDNTTAYTEAEPELTRAIRNTLQSQRGLEVVNNRSNANLILLGNVVSFQRKRDESSTTKGTMDSEDSGGIADGELVSPAITIDVSVDLSLIYPDSKLGVDKLLWMRNFSRSATYRSSERLILSEGASAAPFINRSREKLSLKRLSEQMADEVVDQVKQDF